MCFARLPGKLNVNYTLRCRRSRQNPGRTREHCGRVSAGVEVAADILPFCHFSSGRLATFPCSWSPPLLVSIFHICLSFAQHGNLFTRRDSSNILSVPHFYTCVFPWSSYCSTHQCAGIAFLCEFSMNSELRVALHTTPPTLSIAR